MRVARILSFTGPNIWSRNLVIEVSLVPEPETDASLGAWRESCRRLRETWREASFEPLTTASNEARFNERLPHVVHPAQVFRELVLRLQTLAGTPVERGWVDDGSGRSIVVALEYVEEAVARLAVEAAQRLLWGTGNAAIPELGGLVRQLRECAEQTCFGSTTSAVVTAARGRGIPVSRVDGDCLVQLGHGSRQRRIQGIITSRAGYLAEAVSRDKLLTKRILRQLRLPTAEGRLVRDADDAWSAANEIGLPVVVKPRDADYGSGVSINLHTREQVAAAWIRARESRPDVLVERHLAGSSHRLFVAGDAMVAAVRREPAKVVGDGRRPVHELIAEANRDPRRGNGPECPLYPIDVDERVIEVLVKQELSLASIPGPGRVVSLQRDPTSCRAEEIIDVTDNVHASVAAAVIDAVHAVGLDVAGVDVMAIDIGRPLEEQGGGILEVNAGPAIYLHRSPFCRPQRPVAEAAVDSLFETGDMGRIPLVAVTGDERAGSVARAIARLVDDGSQRIGLAGSAGITIGGRRLTGVAAADAAGCRTLLAHPRVDLAICELPPVSLRNEGLAFDECLVAVFVGFDRKEVAVGTQPDRIRCLRLLAEGVAQGGALVANVDDPQVADQLTPGQAQLVAVTNDVGNAFALKHRAAGGIVISATAGEIVAAQGNRVIDRQPIAAAGFEDFFSQSTNPLEALLAWGAVWAMERHAPGTLRNPLRPVRIDFESNQKRLAPVDRQKTVAAGRHRRAKMA